LDDLLIDIHVPALDHAGNGCRLVGKLGNRYENGSLIYRYADLKGKDFICAWLHALCLNQVQAQPVYLLSADEDLVLLPEYCQLEHLAALIEIYRLGQKQPDAFFVEAALAYIKQAYKLKVSNRASKPAHDVAREQLARAAQQPYEPELRRLYGNVADMELVLGESFEQQCQELLQPRWDATHS
jgi:exodeoxyribonuclease V gamma subunit